MTKLLQCSERCGSHVFTIYKKDDKYIAICDLCYTPQFLDQLKAGKISVDKMIKLKGE